MHIIFDSPKQFKIELDRDDLSALDITYQQMDYNDSHTREVLQGLLKRIGVPGGFDGETGRVLIEVFPRANDGCTVQFTSLETAPSAIRMKKAKGETLVFEFDGVDELIDGVRVLGEIRSEDQGDFDAEFYEIEGVYRAVVYVGRDERRLPHIFGEFARRLKKPTLAAAYTAEHGRRIGGLDSIIGARG